MITPILISVTLSTVVTVAATVLLWRRVRREHLRLAAGISKLRSLTNRVAALEETLKRPLLTPDTGGPTEAARLIAEAAAAKTGGQSQQKTS